jgi:hypothetical protein
LGTCTVLIGSVALVYDVEGCGMGVTRVPEKHLESWRDPDLDLEDQVRVPFVSLKHLKAMHYWLAWC